MHYIHVQTQNTQTSNSWWFQEMTLALPSSRSTLKARISASRASRSSSLVFRFQMRLDCAWSSWNLWMTQELVRMVTCKRKYSNIQSKAEQTCSRKAPSWLLSLFAAASSSGWQAFGSGSENEQKTQIVRVSICRFQLVAKKREVKIK